MMPELYREIFELCGRDPDDYIPMEKLDPMYRVYFSDAPDAPIDISSDLTELTRIIESISPGDTEGFLNYMHDIYKGYIFAQDNILGRPFHKEATSITFRC